MSSRDSVLSLQGVGRTFRLPAGPVEVLRGADLTLQRGDFVMVTGPSGSGKSTLLNICALLDTPTFGKVVFEGREISSLGEDELCAVRSRRIGMVFQRFRLLPHRSVLANVLFRFRYVTPVPEDAADRAEAVLVGMGLAGHGCRPARLLSAGEMQRVAIARAVVLRPSLLLADEPTGNLDAESGRIVMGTFAELHRQGLTILMVTHNEDLLPYGTRHVVCRNGVLT
jgi:putative ABC transport system ATP-binding protein